MSEPLFFGQAFYCEDYTIAVHYFPSPDIYLRHFSTSILFRKAIDKKYVNIHVDEKYDDMMNNVRRIVSYSRLLEISLNEPSDFTLLMPVCLVDLIESRIGEEKSASLWTILNSKKFRKCMRVNFLGKDCYITLDGSILGGYIDKITQKNGQYYLSCRATNDEYSITEEEAEVLSYIL